MAKLFGFSKRERLKSRKLIEDLFTTGKVVSQHPVRVMYKLVPGQQHDEAVLKVGVTVSRRLFKRAVDRNRIKRLLREAYRLQKIELLEMVQQKGLLGYLFFMYVDRSLPTYQVIYDAINRCLKALIQKVSVQNENVS
ncbi:MAG: ribonuclease P protein component [Flavisolibacter sp.]|nr:ribonuclease P protein component [Flavisolibacter sp.]